MAHERLLVARQADFSTIFEPSLEVFCDLDLASQSGIIVRTDGELELIFLFIRRFGNWRYAAVCQGWQVNMTSCTFACPAACSFDLARFFSLFVPVELTHLPDRSA